MASAKIENLDYALNSINNQIAKIGKDFIDRLATDVLLEITKLTNLGLNAYGDPFTPYSTRYRQKRIEEGLRATPNMQYSSNMLKSIIIKTKTDHSVKIGPHGSSNGVSNSFKLASLKERKNYILLAWTPHFKKLLAKHLKKYNKDFGNIKF